VFTCLELCRVSQRVFLAWLIASGGWVSAEAHPQMFDDAYLVFSSESLETLRFPIVWVHSNGTPHSPP
jgi:hypothetical protein